MSSNRVGLSRKRKVLSPVEPKNVSSLTQNAEEIGTTSTGMAIVNANGVLNETKSNSDVIKEDVVEEEQTKKRPKRLSFKLKKLQGIDLEKQQKFEEECRKLNAKELIEEIEYFQSRIKSKQLKVAELQNVEVYAKKHDIKSIDEQFEQWKESCQSALNELLKIAQGRPDGESLRMDGLLNDLQIPNDLVDFNPEWGSFVEKK